MPGHHLGNIHYGDILESGIVDPAHGILMVDQMQIDIGDIVNVYVGAGLIAAKHRYQSVD
tara:strand:+ start:822 stop:1001 length:180 start_codon:yes stop_codon:yes gene_type:complete